VDFLRYSGTTASTPPDIRDWETAVNYKYDTSGRRIKKKVDNYTIRYLYDGGNVIGEYDINDNLLRKYIHGARVDEPVCMINVADSSAVYFYHYDGLGSVVALSDSSGDSCQSYEYSAYGQVAVSDPNFTANPYMFTGRRFDFETGIYLYRCRYYNPYIGRFLQTDLIGYGDGINWYAYCGNNPIGRVDPSGTCFSPTNSGAGTYQTAGLADYYESWKGTVTDYHQELGESYVKYRTSFINWWADSIAKELTDSLGDGVKLTVYGASFGMIGSKAEIDYISKRYGDFVTNFSIGAGGASTVCLGSAYAIEFAPIAWGSATELARKFAMGHEDVYDVYSGARSNIRLDWAYNRLLHTFSKEEGHIFTNDITEMWHWAKRWEEMCNNEAFKVAITDDPQKMVANVTYYLKDLGNGMSLWAYVREGLIIDAGLNLK